MIDEERCVFQINKRFAVFLLDSVDGINLTAASFVETGNDCLSFQRSSGGPVRGIFQNKDGAVTSLISREEFYALQSEQFVEETFDGSLPAFLAAFGSRKKMTDAEIDELKKIIDGFRR